MTLISDRIDRKKLICTIINSSISCEFNSIPYKERNFVWKIAISCACISKFGMIKVLGCLCLGCRLVKLYKIYVVHMLIIQLIYIRANL